VLANPLFFCYLQGFFIARLTKPTFKAVISKKFIKSSLTYTLAGALPMASAIILLPFYILYLPTSAYGALSMCLAFSIFVQIVVTYSFDTSLYIHYHELKDRPAALRSFISASFVFMLGWGLAVGVLLSVTGQLIFSYLNPKETLSFFPYGLISVGVGIFQAIIKVHGNLLQTREKPEPFLWSNLGYFILIAVTTIVGLKMFPDSLIGPLGGRLVAGFIVSLWVYGRVFGEFGIHLKTPWENTSARFNAFTFVYQLQQWAINYFDRFLIGVFLPLAQVGIYDFAVKCLAGIDLLLNGLNASITPKIIQLINKQEKKGSTTEVNRYYYGQLSVIMILISLCILILPIGIYVMINWFGKKSDYAQAIPYLPFLAILYIFKSMRLYFVVPYNVLKKMDRLTFISIVVSLTKIVLLFLVIKPWHINGVIAASFVVAIMEIIMLWMFLTKDYHYTFNGFKLLGAPLLLIAIIVLFESLILQEYALYIHLFYNALCFGLLYYAYRNELALLTPSKFFKR